MLKRLTIVLLWVALLLVGCDRGTPELPTVQQEGPPTPTATAVATATRQRPSPTPQPTQTPTATPAPEPSVVVIQQTLNEEGQIVLSQVRALESGWLSVRRQEEGEPGAVIGYTAVAQGEHRDVPVGVDPYHATETLYVSLHQDTGAPGIFDFPGSDPVIKSGDQPLLAEFVVDIRVPIPAVEVTEQSISREQGEVVVSRVTAPGPAWLVLHADAEGEPGPVLGQSWVEEGDSQEVKIYFDWRRATRQMHVVLHEDGGEVGRFEPESDRPLEPGGERVESGFTATLPVDVFVVAQPASTDEIVVERAVSNEDGWLVVYSDFVGLPADPLGHAAIEAGVNERIVIPIAGGRATPLLHIMVHSDAGTSGVFDNSSVDPALRDANRMLLFSFETDSGSYLLTADQRLGAENSVQVPLVVIEVESWVAIQTDDEGAPGEVLGQVWLPPGVHYDVSVPIEAGQATAALYAVLYEDAGETETFEYPDGPDVPLLSVLRPIQAPFYLLADDE